MRIPTVVAHVLLPCVMAALLLLALAYWWLDNLPHELFGTALFLLLGWHIAVNRFWFRNLFKGRYNTRRVATLVLHVLLIVNMAVLLATSLLISRSIFAAFSIANNGLLREIHLAAAYWVIIVVGVHLGLHWGRVTAIVRTALNLSSDNAARQWLLRTAAALLGIFGVLSWSVLGVWNKLTFTASLEFWDFTSSVSPFFEHWTGVMSLPAIFTHYMMEFLRRIQNSVPFKKHRHVRQPMREKRS